MPQLCHRKGSSSVAHLETTGQHLFCFCLGWYNCLRPAFSCPPSQKLAMHLPLLSLVGTKFRAEWTHNRHLTEKLICLFLHFLYATASVPQTTGSNVPEHFAQGLGAE